MLVNQNRVLLVIIAVIVGCLVNMPQLKLKDPKKKLAVFSGVLYLAYWFLNSQGLVEGSMFDDITAFAAQGDAKAKAMIQDVQKDWSDDKKAAHAATVAKAQRAKCFFPGSPGYNSSNHGFDFDGKKWANDRALCKNNGYGPFTASDRANAKAVSKTCPEKYVWQTRKHNGVFLNAGSRMKNNGEPTGDVRVGYDEGAGKLWTRYPLGIPGPDCGNRPPEGGVRSGGCWDDGRCDKAQVAAAKVLPTGDLRCLYCDGSESAKTRKECKSNGWAGFDKNSCHPNR